MAGDRRDYQVVIVGGGPVGIALCLELGMRGISNAVVERRTGMHNIPKGQNLTQRTLEHFWYWGIADELRAARVMPDNYPIGGVTAYGNMMSEYWHAPAGRELVRKFYFQDNDRLPQYQLENVLRSKRASYSLSEDYSGWTAISAGQDVDRAHVRVRKQSGEELELRADYVVGCDGGHSLVRESAGIKRAGSDFDQVMLLAVFRSRELHELFARFPERTTYRAMDAALNGYWQFFGRIDVGEGWFFHAPVPGDTSREKFDHHALIEKVVGKPFKAEYDHVGFWDLRVMVAEKYREKRMFIAGDAAHTHPPYGGYGLNNGLEDARNLAWKLAAKLQGWGGENLLESYGGERGPVFRDVGEDFIAERIRFEGDFLKRYTPQKDREEFAKAFAGLESDSGQRVYNYEPNYEGSNVVFGPPGAKSSAHGKHMLKARTGHHLSPRQMNDGKDVYDHLGKDFTLLAFGVSDATAAAFSGHAKARKIPLKIVRDRYEGELRDYEAPLILVRPDQFIVWTGEDKNVDADGILRKATGL
ncbi:MAG: monooxygenase [Alphaproteobacteria bacterium]|nr:monooxygenase [Alphaproteobacteria bacterium]